MATVSSAKHSFLSLILMFMFYKDVHGAGLQHPGLSDSSTLAVFSIIMVTFISLALVVGLLICLSLSNTSHRRRHKLRKRTLHWEEPEDPAEDDEEPETEDIGASWSAVKDTSDNLVHRVKSGES